MHDFLRHSLVLLNIWSLERFRSIFAMPECGIGLFTDVAGALFLSSIPGQIGTYLALTGSRLTGAPQAALQASRHQTQRRVHGSREITRQGSQSSSMPCMPESTLSRVPVYARVYRI